MQERVKIVLLFGVGGFFQEPEESTFIRGVLGEKLVAESSSAADDDHAAVRQDLIGGVPSLNRQILLELNPIAFVVSARHEEANLVVSGVIATRLYKGSVGSHGGGGTPDVGLDHERAEGVGSDVVEEGVRRAVFWDFFVIVPAFSVG